MAGDAYWGNVQLLVKFEGANNSTVFTDLSSSPKVITASGDAKISTARFKFGSSSGLFDGAGDYISVPNTGMSPLTLAEDFTVECWVYITANPAAPQRIGGICDAGGGEVWSIGIQPSGAFFLQIYDTAFRAASTAALPLNQWVHVAGVKLGSSVYAFANGARGATVGAMTSAPLAMTSVLSIGRMGAFAGQYFAGNVDDFRITKGVARYTDPTYTVPTETFPEGMGQVSGVVTDGGANVSRTVRAYRRDTGALAGSAVSNAVTGAYSFYTPTLDEVSVICLDDGAGTVQNDLVLRAFPG